MCTSELPLISVIMPVYNGEKFLHEAIESILTQTYTNFEFIILNDGSNDSTESVILSYSDSRIIYIKNEFNIKLIKTLNKGLDIAKGEFIARMDADDISFPNRLEKQLEIFKNFNCDVVGTSYIKIDERGNKIGHHLGINAKGDDLIFVSLFVSPLVHPSVICRSSVLKKYRYNDSSHCAHVEDYDLWSRMIKDGVVLYSTDIPYIYYRRTPNNITEVYLKEIIPKHIKCAQNLQCHFVNNVLNERTILTLIPISINLIQNEFNQSIDDALNLLVLFKKNRNVSFNIKCWFHYRLFVAIIKSNVTLVSKLSVYFRYIYIVPFSILYLVKNIKLSMIYERFFKRL